MALESIWLDAMAGQISSNGMRIGHGNLVPAKPKWQITGTTIAATQRQELAVSVFFFSDFVMGEVGLACNGEQRVMKEECGTAAQTALTLTLAAQH